MLFFWIFYAYEQWYQREGSWNCHPPSLPIITFSPGLLVVLQEILYQLSCALIRLLCSNGFLKENNFFSIYGWSVLVVLFCVYVSLGTFWLCCHLENMNQWSLVCIASYLASHPIMLHNKRIHGHGLKIKIWLCFLVSMETNVKTDSISIILISLYHSRNVNKSSAY